MNNPFLDNGLAWLKNLTAELRQQQSVAYVLAFAVAACLVFGLAVYVTDPNVRSLWDGIWYAWVTMTHVGYGDVVPTSFLGRLLASLLILIGLAVLALLTAMFSAILLGRDMGGLVSDEDKILQELKRLHERLDRLELNRLPAQDPQPKEAGGKQME